MSGALTLAADIVGLGRSPQPTWLTAESASAARALGDHPFEPEEFARRVRRVRDRLSERELDGVVVFRPSSVNYLCGHHTIDPVPQPLLVTHDLLRLYVPDGEVGRALASALVDSIAFTAPGVDELDAIARDVVDICGERASVAFEDWDTSIPPRVLALLRSAGLLMVPGGYLVERLRLRLSAAELACVERASLVTERGALAAVDAAFEPGATDSTVAAAISAALHAEADSSSATDVIVATGRRAGVTHSSFSNTPLADGTTLIEFAGTYHRYHAPLMVTVARRELDETEARLERLAQAMLAVTVAEARPGRAASDVAAAVLAQLGELSDRDIFHFTYGYSVGLAHPPHWEDGEVFTIDAKNDRPLEAGMVLHLPGSFRCFGVGGVGLSHTILLEEAGARVLTGADARVRTPA